MLPEKLQFNRNPYHTADCNENWKQKILLQYGRET